MGTDAFDDLALDEQVGLFLPAHGQQRAASDQKIGQAVHSMGAIIGSMWIVATWIASAGGEPLPSGLSASGQRKNGARMDADNGSDQLQISTHEVFSPTVLAAQYALACEVNFSSAVAASLQILNLGSFE